RAIVISVDPDRLRSYNLTPEDVVGAINVGNFISPSGNVYIEDSMPLVPNNAMIRNPQEFGNIPIKPGENVYIRDVGTVADSTDLNYGYALVNGHKSVYLPIVKKSTASTLQVVADIHRAMPLFKSVLPDDVDIGFEFDESPTVIKSITNVGTEGLIGAVLTGLMVLLGSLFALWITGNTINIMTLGGLALAIGILVDEATVSIENIHVQMTHTPSLARAIERGGAETAIPRFLALVCILSVFIPAFIMAEPIRSFFVPLALAVGFAMTTSYFLSSTLVPVLSVWLLKHHGKTHEEHSQGLFARVERVFGGAVKKLVATRWIVVPVYLGVCLLVLLAVGTQLGTELFPQVDSGEFVLRFRAPPGSNFEITREIAVRALQIIEEEAGGPGSIDISMGFAGQQAPTYSMNNLILFMRGPDDGQMRIALNERFGVKLDQLREKLRTELPDKIKPWLAELLERKGLTPQSAKERADTVTFGFEPGDIVSEVMSFGSPTPIEVAIASPNMNDSKMFAMAVKAEMEKNPYLRDIGFRQSLDYPTVPVDIDRERAGLSGLTARDVADAILVSTS
ncbi:MAG TPA: efflux RND transporter permease subunit, partial [Pirellulales bacterium]